MPDRAADRAMAAVQGRTNPCVTATLVALVRAEFSAGYRRALIGHYSTMERNTDARAVVARLVQHGVKGATIARHMRLPSRRFRRWLFAGAAITISEHDRLTAYLADLTAAVQACQTEIEDLTLRRRNPDNGR